MLESPNPSCGPCAICLYEDDNTRVLYDPSGSDTLLISFAHFGFEPDAKNLYWGQAAVRNLGFSGLGLICKNNLWYPAHSILDLFCAIKDKIQYANIIGYGFSMGGYAALKYGRLFGATTVFSLSPQFSIDPKFYSGNFSSYYDQNLHAKMAVYPCHLADNVYVFYDPYIIEDRTHALEFEALRPGISVALHHMGHYTVEAFASSEVFRELCFLGPKGDHIKVKNLAKRATRAAWRRKLMLATACLKKRPQIADEIADKYWDSTADWWREWRSSAC